MPAPVLISVVSPVYTGEQLVPILVNRICTTLLRTELTFEIILIDDGSKDGSWEQIRQQVALHDQIKGIRLSKNYGQHTAIHAGISQAKGTWVVVMDCDLQDPPEAIPQLFAQLKNTYDAVYAIRDKRNDKRLKKIYSSAFYRLLKLFTRVPFSGNAANFGIYHRDLIQCTLQIHSHYYFFPLAIRKCAQRPTELVVEHAARAAGKTSYSFTKALQLAIRILISNSVFSFLIRKRNDRYQATEIIQKNENTV